MAAEDDILVLGHLTQAEIDALLLAGNLEAGSVVYNTTLGRSQTFNGTIFETTGSPSIQLSSTSTATLDINAAGQTLIPWDVQDIIDTNFFSHTSGQSIITVLKDIDIEIDFKLAGTRSGGGNSRANIWIGAAINNLFEPRSAAYIYIRNSTNPWGSGSPGSFELSLSTGDQIQIFSQRLGESAVINLEGSESWVKLKVVRER